MLKPYKARKQSFDNEIPYSVLKSLFLERTGSYKIAGLSEEISKEYNIDKAIEKHLKGELTIQLNPLFINGTALINVVIFDLSFLKHPFTIALKFQEELKTYKIPSYIEVTEGGKGYYYLWIIHESPVDNCDFTKSIIGFGESIFQISLPCIPPLEGKSYLNMPLQGESVLFQRKVFVNSVGKMIKDQVNFLKSIQMCSEDSARKFIEKNISHKKAQPAPPPVMEMKKESGQILMDDLFSESSTDFFHNNKDKEIDEKTDFHLEIVSESKMIIEIPEIKDDKEETFVKTETVFESPHADEIIYERKNLLVFSAGGYFYGIEPDAAEGIYSFESIRIRQCINKYVFGFLDLKDKPVPVVKLEPFLALPVEKVSQVKRALVINSETGRFAVLTENIAGVKTLDKKIVPAKKTGSFDIIKDVFLTDEKNEILCLDVGKIVENAGLNYADREYFKGGTPERKYLLFSIDNNIYGLNAGNVKEILSADEKVLKSESGSGKSNTINYLGNGIPLIRPVKFFENPDESAFKRPAAAIPLKERIIIVESGYGQFGIDADYLIGLRENSSLDISQPPSFLKENHYIGSLAKTKGIDSFVMIFDETSLGENIKNLN